jgi:hypothetical protein
MALAFAAPRGHLGAMAESKAQREARLKAALRDNLRKRKALERAQDEVRDAGSGQPVASGGKGPGAP